MNLFKSKKILLLVILVVFAFLFYFISSYQDNSVEDIIVPFSSNPSSFKLEPKIVGLPVRLKIPSIGIDTFIEPSGIEPDGSMGVPKGPDGVVWFDKGKIPGENGSAVIAGHYGWKNGIQAVFDNLYKIRSGDKIYIEDDKGVVSSFIVQESRRYDLDANSFEVFVSNDGESHLNLITCEGVWDKVSKSYSKRLVVFADKE